MRRIGRLIRSGTTGFFTILDSIDPKSVMPAYRWLFRNPEIQGQPSADAVKLEGQMRRLPVTKWSQPRKEKCLSNYLLSLKRNYPLPEAPEATE